MYALYDGTMATWSFPCFKTETGERSTQQVGLKTLFSYLRDEWFVFLNPYPFMQSARAGPFYTIYAVFAEQLDSTVQMSRYHTAY